MSPQKRKCCSDEHPMAKKFKAPKNGDRSVTIMYLSWENGPEIMVRVLLGTGATTFVLSDTPAKSIFEFGIFHPGRQNCIDSIDYKRSTLIVAPSYQSQHRRPFFYDRNSFMKHENQLRFDHIIFRCS
jgi:hypothetical protein